MHKANTRHNRFRGVVLLGVPVGVDPRRWVGSEPLAKQRTHQFPGEFRPCSTVFILVFSVVLMTMLEIPGGEIATALPA